MALMARMDQLENQPDRIKIGDLIGDVRAANSVRAHRETPAAKEGYP